MSDPATGGVFDAAADTYERGPDVTWRRIGERLVELVDPQPGERILDAATGAGTTLVPAALRVGPAGSVLGVDLSAGMLDLARRRADAAGLGNVELRVGDFTTISDDGFDAVTCSLGVFFPKDRDAAARHLLSRCRPGGRLGVTVWGRYVWRGVVEPLREELIARLPDMASARPPWDGITEPPALEAFLRGAGADEVEVVVEELVDELRTPEEVWDHVLGSGMRGAVDRLGDQAAEVRERLVSHVAALDEPVLRAEVQYAVARLAP